MNSEHHDRPDDDLYENDARNPATRYRPTTTVGPSPDRITGTTGATQEEIEEDPNLDPLDPTDPLRPGQVGDTTPDAYRETDVNMGRHPQGQSPAPPLERQNADRQDR